MATTVVPKVQNGQTIPNIRNKVNLRFPKDLQAYKSSLDSHPCNDFGCFYLAIRVEGITKQVGVIYFFLLENP